MRNFLLAITKDPISIVGSAIATASAMLFATMFVIDIIGGFHGSPYVGILSFMIIPGIFVFGLLLIPVGVLRYRKRSRTAKERGEAPPRFPIIDLNAPRTRRVVGIFLVLTITNLVILATATYKGVEVMDSTGFCGSTCHTVMEPEHTAYKRSPHARVNCVECHIGPGASWFVKSKLSGAWQVVSVAFDLHPRPIPAPIENLRPARETCEQCHWPTKFVGDQLKVLNRYSEDEMNTELKTVLLLRVGGIQGRDSKGIHWHVDPANRIRYRSDPTRQTIGEVELTQADGSVRIYRNGDSVEGEAVEEWRVMDCVDCHNRPTHIYRQPDEEIDLALYEGRIDRSLPYIRREGRRVLEQDYASHDAARQGIDQALRAYYSEQYPELLRSNAAAIDQATAELGNIYTWNVFPEMNVVWGTYPNHIGHENFPGCFRCHNDEHATDDGEVISQDCDTCHSLLALEEEDPEIVEMLNP